MASTTPLPPSVDDDGMHQLQLLRQFIRLHEEQASKTDENEDNDPRQQELEEMAAAVQQAERKQARCHGILEDLTRAFRQVTADNEELAKRIETLQVQLAACKQLARDQRRKLDEDAEFKVKIGYCCPGGNTTDMALQLCVDGDANAADVEQNTLIPTWSEFLLRISDLLHRHAIEMGEQETPPATC
ncbi:hypothetical protein BC567DRAFT_212987 [Phyllosticta citribraziliensis]